MHVWAGTECELLVGRRSQLALGGSIVVETATLNGLLLGVRWLLEGACAPFFGRLIDCVGYTRTAPAAFMLSSANGYIGFTLLRLAEGSEDGAENTLLLGGAVITRKCFEQTPKTIESNQSLTLSPKHAFANQWL